jgi:hypothetical protein
MRSVCEHCGAELHTLPSPAPSDPGLSYGLRQVLDAVRAAGDLWTDDVAVVCRLDRATALERLEVLRDALGLIGFDPDEGLWLAEPNAPPSPAELAREWRERGVVSVSVHAGSQPPDRLQAAALPQVARALLGQLRRRGLASAGDLETSASREGVRRSLQRLAHDGWIVSDSALRVKGPPLQLWRLHDAPPLDLHAAPGPFSRAFAGP